MTALHKRKLFSTDNPKAAKSIKWGWLNAIHYMAPADIAGVGNLCPWATEGCKESCLFKAGNGVFNSTQQSRIDKAREFMNNRAQYLAVLNLQIEQLKLEASFHSLKLCVRLNGTTDIDWFKVYAQHPETQFTEYTKSIERVRKLAAAQKRGEFLNVSITFSFSGHNHEECDEALRLGVNVAVVFRKSIPALFQFVERKDPNGGFGSGGFMHKVISGDEHDLRHLDERGVVVGLIAKGPAKKDDSGFVVDCGRQTVAQRKRLGDKAA